MPNRYFEDCHEGKKARSPGRTITETDVVMFAGMTGDWSPMHTDEEHAKATPFGGRVAHGMLILAVGSALLLRSGPEGILPESTMALYGIERVRFLHPTRFGDTIRTEGEVTKVTELDQERGVITMKGTVKNQDDENLVVFTMRAIVGRRPVG